MMPMPSGMLSGSLFTKRRKNPQARQAAGKPGIVLLLAFLTFTAFYAESFIFTHLEHEHDHDGADGCCSLCSEIETVIMLLEGFGRIAGAVLAAVIIACIKTGAPKPAAACGIPPTPVALKVRMNS